MRQGTLLKPGQNTLGPTLRPKFGPGQLRGLAMPMGPDQARPGFLVCHTLMHVLINNALKCIYQGESITILMKMT